MSPSSAESNKPLSKRQRRMLQDMGIDVFTTRQAEFAAIADAAKDTVEVIAPLPDVAESSSDSSVRIQLNVVATSTLVHLGEVPLSAQELRFLQDLASAVHWARTHSGLKDKVRNTEFRWPIVEAVGTPERAVAAFCRKHQMLSGEMLVLITPAAQAALAAWVSEATSHWISIETLSEVSSHGDAKKDLWQQVVQRLGLANRSATDLR